MKYSSDIKTWKNDNVASLIKLIESQKILLAKMYIEISFGKDKKNSQIKRIRKTIARIQTIISEKLHDAAQQENI